MWSVIEVDDITTESSCGSVMSTVAAIVENRKDSSDSNKIRARGLHDQTWTAGTGIRQWQLVDWFSNPRSS
ncbi:hypothetical protein L6452_21925 [Arctium lappa]|uniref:Uncharacterized protein n=1 Tax=Arctium lappa TaxID=4217 RepID=A0ACB9AXT1_ARCLA|nr:hypothetical protein L6452_21925 [Arctium lappa]